LDQKIKDYIKSNEGLRLKVYKDSLGFLTVGYGHLINASEAKSIGKVISQEKADDLFEKDFNSAMERYSDLKLNLNDNRKMAIVDMIFQLGIGGVMAFHNMLSLLKEGRFDMAADALMDSLYAKQTPNRAKKNHDLILNG
jgi:GH24 family phage-related lysozyme (muramidase)